MAAWGPGHCLPGPGPWRAAPGVETTGVRAAWSPATWTAPWSTRVHVKTGRPVGEDMPAYQTPLGVTRLGDVSRTRHRVGGGEPPGVESARSASFIDG